MSNETIQETRDFLDERLDSMREIIKDKLAYSIKIRRATFKLFRASKNFINSTSSHSYDEDTDLRAALPQVGRKKGTILNKTEVDTSKTKKSKKSVYDD